MSHLRIGVWSWIGLSVATGLFVVAAFLYRDALHVRSRFIGMPVSVPMSPGEMETPEFVAEKGIYYDIEIASHGAFLDSRHLDVSWEVSEQGRSIAKGDSTQYHNRDGDDQIIGFFRPEHDGRYKLHATARNPVGTSLGSPPELIVTPEMGQRDDIAMGAGILESASVVCLLVGLMALSFALTGIFTTRKNVEEQTGVARHG